MTNHPGRRKPTWVADAEAVAAERIAATQWPAGDGTHILTRAELQQVITDAVVHGYGHGLRAATMILSGARRKTT